MCDGTILDHISREICQNKRIHLIINKIYTHDDDDVAGAN